MQTLVLGASGATGKKLVEQLLSQNRKVKAIVRSPEKLPKSWQENQNLEIITASILDLSDKEISEQISDCTSIASCLGHNLTWKGIYGQPRRLVTDATRKICDAVKMNSPKSPTRFVLMNTTGNSNRDLDEPISFAQKCVIGILRLLLPPHTDNEKAADFLRTQIGQSSKSVEWAVVRPDNLIDLEEVTEYEIYPSPIRSAIFDAGQTSRINVGNFIARLMTEDKLWEKWKGQMPVIYNKSAAN
ncbi:MAG: NAD(P)-dependent oxidoreductase [Calditrichaeota bacterium]|nr:MAG: NAD(P)-dependent oxidoreductase [Calditrichota bacterium]